MVKLNDRKIRWIIQQKLGGRGTGELALIQRVSRRRVEQLWQAYRRDSVIPALKKAGRSRNASISLRDAALILETYDRLKVNALTLQRALKHTCGVDLPHNKIHAILKENGRALPQPSKQRRRKWVRYEREHSMSLWHMDWKQLSDGRWWIAIMDDASRLIMSHSVFQDATADSTSINATLAVNLPTVWASTLTLSRRLGPIPPAESQLTTMIRLLSSLKRRTSLPVLTTLSLDETPFKT